MSFANYLTDNALANRLVKLTRPKHGFSGEDRDALIIEAARRLAKEHTEALLRELSPPPATPSSGDMTEAELVRRWTP